MTNNRQTPGESGGTAAVNSAGAKNAVVNSAAINSAPPESSGGIVDNGVVFDANSGISHEEQREILDGINSIAEKNRRSLSGATAGRSFKAVKNGGLFPVTVNVLAVVFLAGGFFLISSLHGREDVRIREGKRVFNTAERALISEIRKETSIQIEAKENEISQIVSKMDDVDAQLADLYSSNRELTAEQRAAEENLKKMQEEYRLSLASLQDDRSRILESARVREAGLYAQLEERNREITALSEKSEAALSLAHSELDKLRTEQEKAAAVEAQLASYFQAASELIRKGQLVEAGDTLKTMRSFLNTPAFQGFRSIQARKDVYARSITALEAMVEEARKNQEALAAAGKIPDGESDKALQELAAKNADLEKTIAGLNQSLQALSSQGSGTATRLVELENSTATLQTLNTTLESNLMAREQTIASLESENKNLNQTVAARNEAIRELQTQKADQEVRIESLDTQLSSLRQALQALSQ